ncbi:MAG TPA: diacylglycerol kinase [Janthinobacterium sp.]|nr:diacylglycerol kinase [Janthinobacterium sp.]
MATLYDEKSMKQPVNEFKSKSGIKRIFSAFFYSLDGFKSAWRYEHAFRQELVLCAVGAAIALALRISAFEKLMLIGVLMLVLIVELINSAIEAVVDRISLERHPLSKNAKDFGSAAVFLAVCLAAAAWAVVLFNRFY